MKLSALWRTWCGCFRRTPIVYLLPTCSADICYMPRRDPGSPAVHRGNLVHPVLYNTYAASELHKKHGSGTYRKLQAIVSDLGRVRRRGSSALAQHEYKLVLLYQRQKSSDPFNCSLHVPLGAECAQFTREDMKKSISHDLALHRHGDAPRRLNVGFWVCALWLMRSASEGRRFPFVWYLEDDVYLPGSWSRFMRKYDRTQTSVDLLVPQLPYRLLELNRGRPEDELKEKGWKRPMLGFLRTELAVVRGKAMRVFRRQANASAGPWTPSSYLEPTQLSIPHSTLARRLPVRDEIQYAKAPLYVWRMSGRLAKEVADALLRGARAHEEFLVPTVCDAMLHQPPCLWRTFEAEDIGVPGGANKQDGWYMANRPEFRSQLRHNLSGFQVWVNALQKSGGSKLLSESPQRLYHPVKGQLGGQTQDALTISHREAGGV